jgi:hypothetical protein
MTTTALTVKQARFADHYLVTGNATEAARRAGYSERTARQMASENLSKPAIKTRLQALQQAQAAKMGLTRQDVIRAVLEAVEAGKRMGIPSVEIRGWIEVAKLCGFYDPESIKAEQSRLRPDGSEDLRFVSTPELMRRISEGGEFRNADGSPMRVAEIDAFYRGLSDDEIRALAEGRARVVTIVEVLQHAL